MNILVVGDANADLSATVEQFPHEGDDRLIESLGWSSGGSATNVAIGLALLQMPVQLLTRVGTDPAAEIVLTKAREAGVDLSLVQRDPQLPTGLCYVVISPNGERTMFSFRGANAALSSPSDLDATLAQTNWLHIGGHSLLEGAQRETTLQLIEAAHQRDIPISLDLVLPTVRARHDELLNIMPRLTVLFANQEELQACFPGSTRDEALIAARARCDGIVVMKCGEQGCIVVAPSFWHTAPAFPVVAVDANGCGDAFVAGFIAARLSNARIEDCALMANAMGALTATRSGAASALPSRAELMSFLAEHYRL